MIRTRKTCYQAKLLILDVGKMDHRRVYLRGERATTTKSRSEPEYKNSHVPSTL
jgi:hypothetical protein